MRFIFLSKTCISAITTGELFVIYYLHYYSGTATVLLLVLSLLPTAYSAIRKINQRNLIAILLILMH